MSTARRMHLTTSTRSCAPDGGGSGFDEQFFKPSLYEHVETSAEAEILHPYPTIIEIESGDLHVPGPLSFVQSNWFGMLTAVITLTNMVMLYFEFAVPPQNRYGVTNEQLMRGNEACLGYFVVEILLRLAHFKCWFFYHQLDARWNIFDIVIVTLGALDQWVLPRIVPEESGLDRAQVFTFLRVLRVLRFLRMLKLLGVCLRTDFRWTGTVWFNSVVSFVIVLSIIIMGVETDVKSPLWEPLDSCVLGFFVFELFVRFRRQGRAFFTEEGWLWNLLDMFIVVFGVIDQWLLNMWMSFVWGEKPDAELGDILLIIRMLRLLRVLRLLRLVKAVRPLYLLAAGVIEAMQSMFWVLVLTLVSLYTVAILMTRLVGHGDLGGELEKVPESTKDLFESVPASMFTLFVLMNGEEWHKVMPLLERSPCMKGVFVAFTIFSSWALLSVMTGVVSDNMISAKKSQNQRDERMHGERAARIQGVLDELFNAAGAHGSDRISRARYEMIMEVPFYARKLQNAVPNISLKDLRDLFTWLDTDDSAKVSKTEFARGLHTVTEPLTGKALLYMDADLKGRFRELHSVIATVESDLARQRARSAETHDNLLKELLNIEEIEEFGDKFVAWRRT